MECTEDEAALRSKIRTNLRVTRVIALNASAACQTSTDLMASCSVNLPPRALVTINLKVLTVSFYVLTVTTLTMSPFMYAYPSPP